MPSGWTPPPPHAAAACTVRQQDYPNDEEAVCRRCLGAALALPWRCMQQLEQEHVPRSTCRDCMRASPVLTAAAPGGPAGSVPAHACTWELYAPTGLHAGRGEWVSGAQLHAEAASAHAGACGQRARHGQAHSQQCAAMASHNHAPGCSSTRPTGSGIVQRAPVSEPTLPLACAARPVVVPVGSRLRPPIC